MKSCRNCIQFHPDTPFGDICAWSFHHRVINPDRVCHNWSHDESKERPATMPEIETKETNGESNAK